MRVRLPSGREMVIWRGGFQIVKEGEPHPKDNEVLPAFRFGDVDLLFVEVTDACNYKCVHCYNGPYRTSNTMRPNDLERALSALESAGYRFKVIQITGGEPTTHPYLEEILEVSSRHARKLQLFTNGSLIREVIDALEKFRERLLVRVSFYSMENDTYFSVTGQREVEPERVLENVLLLRSREVNVRVEVPLIPNFNDGEENIKKIRELFGRLGIPVRFSYMISYGWAKKLEKKKVSYEPFTNWYFALPSLQGYNECWATHLAFDAKFNVYPCVFAREYYLGNALSDDPKQIMERHKEVSRAFGPDSMEVCSSCDLKYVCKRCPPRAKAEGVLGRCEAFCSLCST